MLDKAHLGTANHRDANSRNNSLTIVIFGCRSIYITTIVLGKVFVGREDRVREGTIPQQASTHLVIR